MAYKMKQALESNIAPELFILMKFDEKAQKKSKSTVNSPSTVAGTPIEYFKRHNQKDEFPFIGRNNSELPEIGSDKLKGFEDIGLFSEFDFAKNINKKHGSDERLRRRTIHIADLMGTGNKMNLLRSAGALEVYNLKKKEYLKEVILRDNNVQKFFHHTEKAPEFFHTPPISPKFLPSISLKKSESRNLDHKTLNIDQIIEKCEAAMYLKPPKVLKSSISPKFQKSESDKVLKKKRVKIIA